MQKKKSSKFGLGLLIGTGVGLCVFIGTGSIFAGVFVGVGLAACFAVALG